LASRSRCAAISLSGASHVRRVTRLCVCPSKNPNQRLQTHCRSLSFFLAPQFRTMRWRWIAFRKPRHLSLKLSPPSTSLPRDRKIRASHPRLMFRFNSRPFPPRRPKFWSFLVRGLPLRLRSTNWRSQSSTGRAFLTRRKLFRRLRLSVESPLNRPASRKSQDVRASTFPYSQRRCHNGFWPQ